MSDGRAVPSITRRSAYAVALRGLKFALNLLRTAVGSSRAVRALESALLELEKESAGVPYDRRDPRQYESPLI